MRESKEERTLGGMNIDTVMWVCRRASMVLSIYKLSEAIYEPKTMISNVKFTYEVALRNRVGVHYHELSFE